MDASDDIMTRYNSMAEDYYFKSHVINMTQQRDVRTCVSYPIKRSGWMYAKYIEMVHKAVIRYKTENPTPNKALIFYSFAYENGVLPADNSIIIRVQHGDEYHQFHVHMDDIQNFDFYRYNIMSTFKALDRRTEYTGSNTRQHVLTRSTGDATYEFLKTYGAIKPS